QDQQNKEKQDKKKNKKEQKNDEIKVTPSVTYVADIDLMRLLCPEDVVKIKKAFDVFVSQYRQLILNKILQFFF
ncbi:MAG TPA: hypothetical protein PK683_13960, partial [Leptospiraceae bacterium]|nr:hypothetical protein [Leptospiraceae bacterium]